MRTKICQRIGCLGCIVSAAITVIALVALLSCTKTVYVPVHSTQTVTETVHDTIVKIKLDQSREVVTILAIDTTSTLKNKYCKSTAGIQNGMLTHTLETLPNAAVETRIQYVDKVIVDSIPYPVEVKGETVYVDRIPIWSYIIWTLIFVAFILFMWLTKK